MPQWAGSCWYYLRYIDPNNTGSFVGKEAESYWMGGNAGGVDLYVGGTEHAVLHLLYARFWHKILYDYGLVSTKEPFHKLVNQGLILGEDGQKMSKSRGNVINPDDVVQGTGADSLRLYEMFMGPLEQVKPWSTHGVEGVSRFLARVWQVAFAENQEGEWEFNGKVREDVTPDKALNKLINTTVKKVTEDIEKMSFNTAISAMMPCSKALLACEKVPLGSFVSLLTVLNPFAPHLTEEVYFRLSELFPSLSKKQLCEQEWPQYDPAALVEDEIKIMIQINGKLRGEVMVPTGASKEETEAAALTTERVKAILDGLTVRKVIVVPGRLVNIVAG